MDSPCCFRGLMWETAFVPPLALCMAVQNVPMSEDPPPAGALWAPTSPENCQQLLAKEFMHYRAGLLQKVSFRLWTELQMTRRKPLFLSLAHSHPSPRYRRQKDI